MAPCRLHWQQQERLADVRFENLEPGHGYVLVIDDQGYVYNSGVPLEGLGGRSGGESQTTLANSQEIAELRAEIATLKRQMDGRPASAGSLWQNTPNPFSATTEIGYELKTQSRNAYIIIYTLNGQELQRYGLGSQKGKITVNGADLSAGIYLYSLVVDGHEVETKRMVISR